MDQNELVMSDDDDEICTTGSEGRTIASEDSESDSIDKIEHARNALASCPPDHPDRAECAASLGYHLYMGYAQSGDISMIDEAIEAEREVLALRPPGHPDRAHSCIELGLSLYTHYKLTGHVSLLDEAIELKREALSLRPPGHPHRADSCASLASSLHTRYEQTGDVALLDEAIELKREALLLRPPGHHDRASSCANLGASLHTRYEQTGDVALLHEAIELKREALALRPPGHPGRSNSCANLGVSLHVHYEQTGDVALLDEAIELKREALLLRPPGHLDRADSCADLAVSLHTRYEQTGDVTLLDESIELKRKALSLRPPGSPYRATSCGNLAASLHLRYKLTGDVALLDEAIKLDREALSLRPPGHPHRAISCASLGASLHTRYEQTGDVALLDEAIKLEREALLLRPPGHFDRADSCANLASSLHTRYQQTGDVALLDESIELDRKALSLRPQDHPHRAISCANLSLSLHIRYEQTGDIALLDEAIETCIYATNHSSASRVWHPLTQLSRLHLLCNSPHYSVSQALEYLQQSFQHEVHDTHRFISDVCYIAALMWDNSAGSSHTTALLVDVYAKIVSQLPLVAGFVLDTSSRLKTLKSTRQVGSDACVAALLAEQPATAVTLLDRAHGVVWTQALHQRDPQMEGAPKDLAIELEELLRATAASAPVDPTRLLEHTQDLRHRQNARIQTILREIRAMPGLARFMLGSTYETLREAACNHPVVVLVAARGHAFAIVTVENEPYALRLDLTSNDLLSLRGSAEQAGLRSRADTRDGHTDARLLVQISKKNVHHQPLRVLADIWRKVVKPVIDHLGLEVCGDKSIDIPQVTRAKQKATGRSRPRLHWCANGDFVFLPIHAAGMYTGPQANQACCSDFVVSSYTPTISALLRAQKSAAPIASADVNMLLVGEDCATNLSMSKLASVGTELRCVEATAITKQFGHTVEAIPREATVERVTDRVKSANFVHLACHGIQHPTNALESGFYLRDGMLTILKLMELKLDKPWFAYLSACETAKGDAEQPDQVMHLAAAMLFAGFKSVVATMWSVSLCKGEVMMNLTQVCRSMDDEDGPLLAEWFYEDLMSNKTINADAVAYALDGAVQKLRAKEPSPKRWAQFIHLGA
jgi:tetratricopeptide (TPR) repeat protein